MGVSNRRPLLGERLRPAALPITACVFVVASSAVLNKRGPGVALPPEPPLYQRDPGATLLTSEQRRSCSSAILIATGSDPIYRLTSAAEGVRFDIDADGTAEQVPSTPRNSSVAFLAIDQNEDGRITSGKELFGRHTWPGASNGVAALTRMTLDTNGGVKRGSVSEDDPLFARLLLWTDTNHNGISERAELQAAGRLFSDLSLGYKLEYGRDLFGNAFVFEGWAHVRTAPGRNHAASWEESTQRRRRFYAVCFAQSIS